MKIVYIAIKEELQSIIKESIHEEIETILKRLDQKTIPERMNLADTAQYLGVSKSSMYKLTMTRKIPFNKFGRRIFFYTKDIDNWLKDNAPHYKSRDEIANEAAEYMSKVAKKKLDRRRY
jgi:excisionase family DNA binding protein